MLTPTLIILVNIVSGIFYVITEYCSKGSLRKYLLSHKKKFVRVSLDEEDEGSEFQSLILV